MAVQPDEPSPAAAGGVATVAAVVVAYRPDPERLSRLLGILAGQVAAIHLVDNSETPADRAAVAEAIGRAGVVARAGTIGRAEATPQAAGPVQAEATGQATAAGPAAPENRLPGGARIEHLPMDGNRGIAAAQNRGIAAALAEGRAFVLLADDDSQPPVDLVPRLLAIFADADAHADAVRTGRRIAAVGPLVYDQRDPAAVLAFGHTRLGPQRIAGARAATAPLPAAFLIASGCLIRSQALRDAGPMREDLFIDHVDLEWGLRTRRAGWTLLVDPGTGFAHRLGDRVVRPWPWKRPFHVHAPLRNAYLVRNTLLLMRGRLLPAGWRLGYLLWLLRYCAFNLVFVAPRRQRLAAILRGVGAGLAGRGCRL